MNSKNMSIVAGAVGWMILIVGSVGAQDLNERAFEEKLTEHRIPRIDVNKLLIERISQFSRKRVAHALQRAANDARVLIDIDAVATGTGSDTTLVNAPIAGIEGITLEDLASGAEVGFVFLEAPQTRTAPNLTSGFYVVRVFSGFDGADRASLIDQKGEEIASVPARVSLGALGQAVLEVRPTVGTVGSGSAYRFGWSLIGTDINLQTSDILDIELSFAVPPRGVNDRYCGPRCGPPGDDCPRTCDDFDTEGCASFTLHLDEEGNELFGVCIEPTG